MRASSRGVYAVFIVSVVEKERLLFVSSELWVVNADPPFLLGVLAVAIANLHARFYFFNPYPRHKRLHRAWSNYGLKRVV